MQDPVMTLDGITYERSAIEAHFDTCTQLLFAEHGRLIETRLIPNGALRAAIESWTTSHVLLPVPTFAVNALQRTYGSDVLVETDDVALTPGVRKVSSSTVSDRQVWATVQKRFRAKSIECDATNGLPYTQLAFSVASVCKIARILDREQKKKIERRFHVIFLVESDTGKPERQITLTAWNSNGNVANVLDQCRTFILSKI
jgi:hypothetical protein